MTRRGDWDTAAELLGLAVTERSRWRRRPVIVEGDIGDIHIEIWHWVGHYTKSTSLYVHLPPGGWDETRFRLYREGMFHPPPGSIYRFFTEDDEFDATFVLLPKSDPQVLMELFTSENQRTLLDLNRVLPDCLFDSGSGGGFAVPIARLHIPNPVYTDNIMKRRFGKSGRLPATEIVNQVIVMTSAAKALATNTSNRPQRSLSVPKRVSGGAIVEADSDSADRVQRFGVGSGKGLIRRVSSQDASPAMLDSESFLGVLPERHLVSSWRSRISARRYLPL
jgi:hypothetical protein